MSLVIDYRPPQPRRSIINRTSLRLLFLVMGIIAFVALASFISHAPRATGGTTQATVFSFVDARTGAPIPITVGGPTSYPATDPWNRKITVTAPNTVRIQWVDPKAPSIYISSPGYQGVGIIGLSNRPTLTMGLWPAPPGKTLPATGPSPTTTTANN